MSAAKKRRLAAARRAEERAWDEQNGPVLIRIRGHEIYAKSKAVKDVQAARDLLLRSIENGSVRPIS